MEESGSSTEFDDGVGMSVAAEHSSVGGVCTSLRTKSVKLSVCRFHQLILFSLNHCNTGPKHLVINPMQILTITFVPPSIERSGHGGGYFVEPGSIVPFHD